MADYGNYNVEEAVEALSATVDRHGAGLGQGIRNLHGTLRDFFGEYLVGRGLIQAGKRRATRVTLRRLKECQGHGLAEWGFVTPNKHLITDLFTLGWVAKKPGVTKSPASADDVVITEEGLQALEEKEG